MFKQSWFLVLLLLGLLFFLFGCTQSLTEFTQPLDNAKRELSVEELNAANEAILANSDLTTLDFVHNVTGNLSGDGDIDMWQTPNVRSGRFIADLSGPSNADFDLYIRAGSQPTLSSYDCRGYTSSSTEHCEISISSTTTVYTMVRSYSGSGSYALRVENVTSGGSPPPSSGILAESPHPYSNNYTNTWTISSSGADQIRIHFSRLETESGYDYIYIYDRNNNQVTSYSGIHNNTWTPWVNGDTIKVKLVTDYSVTAYGFVVDNKEVRSGGGTPPPAQPSDLFDISVTPLAVGQRNVFFILEVQKLSQVLPFLRIMVNTSDGITITRVVSLQTGSLLDTLVSQIVIAAADGITRLPIVSIGMALYNYFESQSHQNVTSFQVDPNYGDRIKFLVWLGSSSARQQWGGFGSSDLQVLANYTVIAGETIRTFAYPVFLSCGCTP